MPNKKQKEERKEMTLQQERFGHFFFGLMISITISLMLNAATRPKGDIQ